MLNRSFVRRVEKEYQRRNTPPDQHIFINHEAHSFHIQNYDGAPLIYSPTKTGKTFHECDDLVRCTIGCYGSGKTTMMLADIILRSCQMPMINGKRFSRWAIIRNTYAELESTTYVSWCAWFGNLGNTHRNKKPLLTMRHNFNDDKGEIELEVIFIALDSESDVRKLKSLEVCGIYINEASEIPYAVFEHAAGRVGRYMLNQMPEYWKGVILDTNPPNRKHWIPRIFEDEQVQSHAIFHQPPGILEDADGNYTANPLADNFERLGAHYYTNMAYGKTKEFISVYCKGQYGSVIMGKNVYHEYNDDMHAIDEIKFEPLRPVYIGMDFGLTPAAIFVQETSDGRYNIIHELVTEQLGISQFIDNVFAPFINRHLQGVEIGVIVGDPAGEKKNENDMTSCFDILRNKGHMIRGASTNLITPRLESVRNSLNLLIEGKPKFLVSRKGCPILREGFLGGYSYKKLRVLNGEAYDSKPDKNEYSHIHDALQYIILHLNSAAHKVPTKYEPHIMRF